MKKSSLWPDTRAKEFETLGEIEVFADGEEEEQTDGRDDVPEMAQNEMVHLLQHGLPDEV
jgi:hypothetical protein